MLQPYGLKFSRLSLAVWLLVEIGTPKPLYSMCKQVSKILRNGAPPAVVLDRVRLGECNDTVSDLVSVLKGNLPEDGFYFEHEGVPFIKENEVDLKDARVLYLGRAGGGSQYFHVVLLLDGYVYDPYGMEENRRYDPVKASDFFSKNDDDYEFSDGEMAWVYETNAESYSAKNHMIHIGAFHRKLLRYKTFREGLKSGNQEMLNVMKIIDDSKKNSPQKLPAPQAIKGWLEKQNFKP